MNFSTITAFCAAHAACGGRVSRRRCRGGNEDSGHGSDSALPSRNKVLHAMFHRPVAIRFQSRTPPARAVCFIPQPPLACWETADSIAKRGFAERWTEQMGGSCGGGCVNRLGMRLDCERMSPKAFGTNASTTRAAIQSAVPKRVAAKQLPVREAAWRASRCRCRGGLPRKRQRAFLQAQGAARRFISTPPASPSRRRSSANPSASGSARRTGSRRFCR